MIIIIIIIITIICIIIIIIIITIITISSIIIIIISSSSIVFFHKCMPFVGDMLKGIRALRWLFNPNWEWAGWNKCHSVSLSPPGPRLIPTQIRINTNLINTSALRL